MFSKTTFLFAAIFLLPASVRAQQGDASAKISIRATLHDPVNPVADLFVADDAGGFARLNLIPQGLSNAQLTVPVNGSLALYKTAAVDIKNPQASMVASVKVPQGLKKGIIVIVPAGENANPPYRMVLVDDSPTGFPKGESRVLSLVPVETALEIGEHKLPAASGKLTNVPPVKKVNEFNMAQTNFYYKDRATSSWVPITERQLQYLDEFRRIFIIHTTLGAADPSVATIVDTAPSAAPAAVGAKP